MSFMKVNPYQCPMPRSPEKNLNSETTTVYQVSMKRILSAILLVGSIGRFFCRNSKVDFFLTTL